MCSRCVECVIEQDTDVGVLYSETLQWDVPECQCCMCRTLCMGSMCYRARHTSCWDGCVATQGSVVCVIHCVCLQCVMEQDTQAGRRVI